jgi:hypothetical protein
MKAKVGDTFNPGDLVYLDPADDVQTVSSAGTKAIGVYVGPLLSAAPAGSQVEVHLGHRYPGDTLMLA